MSTQTTKPVFLICSERSGSNLISTIMGTHSEIYALPPIHFGLTALLNMHETVQAGVESKAWTLIKRRLVRHTKTHLDDEIANKLKRWLNSQDKIDPQKITRYVFEEMAPRKGAGITFIKEKKLHHMMFFLLQCYPEAQFVFQVRDPRDFLVSAKTVQPNPDNIKFKSVRNALRIWNDDQMGGLRALGLLGKDRVFLHRYEDLISDPQEVLQRLCSFLGLEFEPGMLDFHKTDEAIKLAGSARPRKNVSQPLISGNFAKYRKGLTTKEIRKVENQLGDLMDIFGYPREREQAHKPYRFLGPKNGSLKPDERPPLLPLLSYDT